MCLHALDELPEVQRLTSAIAPELCCYYRGNIIRTGLTNNWISIVSVCRDGTGWIAEIESQGRRLVALPV